MKKFTLFLAVIFIFLFHSYSQTINGKLLDENNNPIAYASIQIKNTGVLSNEEGDFSVNIDKFNDDDIVNISFLGFEKLEIPLKDFSSKNYTLNEEINELSQVTVSTKKLSVNEIITKVVERIDSNYVNQPTEQQIFIRTSDYNKYKNFEFEFLKATLLSRKALKEVNKSLDNLIHNNLNKASKSHSEKIIKVLSFDDETKLEVLKSTILVNKKKDKSSEKFQSQLLEVIANHLEKDATYKVKSGILPVMDSLKIEENLANQLYKKEKKVSSLKTNITSKLQKFDIHNDKKYGFLHKQKKYNYKLKGIAKLDGEKIYIIGFSPRKSSALYQGILYINAYDFALVKTVFDFAPGKNFSKNLKFLLGVKFAISQNKFEIIFKKNNDDQYFLKFAKQETSQYMFLNRSLKFTKNRADRSENKKMIKMEFLMEADTKTTTELLILNQNELSKANFKKFKEKEKYKLEYISRYTPDTWKGYNVLAPIQEIKDYDTGEVNPK